MFGRNGDRVRPDETMVRGGGGGGRTEWDEPHTVTERCVKRKSTL
jgi:hypothetical protein